MGGGELQLITKGQLDAYLTGNPEISYFKHTYKRHTNFSIDSFKLDFDSIKPSLINGTMSNNIYRCKINRYGDLLSHLYLCYTLPDVYSSDVYRFKWIENVGTMILKSAKITANGLTIDNITGEWLIIWNELILDDVEGYNKITGNIDNVINPSNNKTIIRISNNKFYDVSYPASEINSTTPSINSYDITLPLKFWFSRNPALALPLIQMQNTEVYLNIEIENAEKLYQVYDNNLDLYISPSYYNTLNKTNININSFVKTIDLNAYIEAYYFYLDTNERTALINMPASILVEQLEILNDIKYTGSTSETILTINLNSHKLTKEIVWIIKRDDNNKFNTHNNYTATIPENTRDGIMKNAKILWNSSYERVEEKPAYYYNYIQPYQYHTKIPKQGIYTYSFDIYPEKWAPSGYFNGTILDTGIIITFNGNYNNNTINSLLTKYYSGNEYTFGYTVSIYVLSYNFFEIMGGVCAMKYM